MTLINTTGDSKLPIVWRNAIIFTELPAAIVSVITLSVEKASFSGGNSAGTLINGREH